MFKLAHAFALGAMVLIWSAPAPVSAEPTVGSWVLVSKKRVSRVQFEYEFKVELRNPDAVALTSVRADLTSRSDATVIVQDELLFGDVPAGATVTSSNTFKIRHNRRYRFNKKFVHFAITGVAEEASAGPMASDARHLLERITFGITPELLEKIGDRADAEQYLARQLEPETVDDTEFAAMVDGFTPTSEAELVRWQLLHAIHSKRQLREVMTAFWDNHLNTDLASHGNVAWELAENEALRAHALGNFLQLLLVSAKSPAMLYYLDGVNNVAEDPDDPDGPGPNQNYGRELQELHSLGVNGGYTEDDVQAAARAFTGWTVVDGAFHFDPDKHDTAPKVFLKEFFPEGGKQDEGERVLEMVARHPSTARFICTKLVVLLANDDPPGALVDACSAAFEANAAADDQIARAVSAILGHTAFHASANVRSKVKTPLELAASIARNFGVSTAAIDLPVRMSLMGMRLFRNAVPTGYGETGAAWVNPALLLERVNFADWAAFRPAGGGRTAVDPWTLVQVNSLTSKQAITEYFLRIAVGDDYSDAEHEQALTVLGTTPEDDAFDPFAPGADYRLRTLLATILSFPSYQFQ